jgi:hypothetical protein
MILPIGLIGLGCALLGVAAGLYTRICRYDATRCTGVTSSRELYEAWQMSKLVERAEAGEDVIFARAGKPVAKLVKFHGSGLRRGGQWRGTVNTIDRYRALRP